MTPCRGVAGVNTDATGSGAKSPQNGNIKMYLIQIGTAIFPLTSDTAIHNKVKKLVNLKSYGL